MHTRLALGQWPTPVRPLFALRPNLWLKDDGACHPAYGGNKVRKLEYLLSGAQRRIVTVGAVGSHHVLATAIHARLLGHTVEAVLLPRPYSAHAEAVLSATLPLATLHFHADIAAGVAHLQQLGAAATLIPAGGSNAVGALGWVDAGIELAEQVRAGLLPEPQRIFIPLGTGATVAGLATGVRRAGLQSQVIGVRVVPTFVTPIDKVDGMGGPVDIDDRWLGAGYGEPTPEAEAAVARAAAVGLHLETTYTGKCLAAALDAHGGPDLWWNTLSTVPLPPGAPVDRAAFGW